MNAKEAIQNTVVSVLSTVLSKEGLVGTLLTVMIFFQLYQQHRTTSSQLEVNSVLKTHVVRQTDILEKLTVAIERGVSH